MLVVLYLVIAAKSVMLGCFTKFLFLILVLLAFLGILELLRIADHKQGTLYGERNRELYNQKSLEEETGAATPSAQVNGDNNGSVLDFRDILNRLYVDQHVPKPWIGSYQCKDVICSEFL